MEQLTILPRPGDPGAMEPWAMPAWQNWTPSPGGEPGALAPCLADTPALLQVRTLKPEENSEPEGAHSSGSGGDPLDPEGVGMGLPDSGQQAVPCDPGVLLPGHEQVEVSPKAKPSLGLGDRPPLELLRALAELQQRCAILKEENQMLRKSSFPETEEKVRRLKRKNAELAVIAKRLEERARKLQETNLRVVSAPLVARGGPSAEWCRKVLARQRARDLSETASALLDKDKQIAALQRECRELQARLTLLGKEGPQWLHVRDFDRLLRESQREVLRLQRQIALRNLQAPSALTRPRGPAARAGAPAPGAPGEALVQEDVGSPPAVLGEAEKEQRLQQLASELCKKRKKCESLEQEARKKQKRCEELELQLREAQDENARLAQENSRLSGQAAEKEQVDWENEELRGQLLGVTQERDLALRKSQSLQIKLESLEQVLKHMREVAQRRQQLELEHEQARLSLLEKQEEVRRLQQAQAEAKREHEGAMQLLEVRVRELEEQCRSQTERFSLLAQELQAFRLHPGPLDLLTSALGCPTLGDRPPPPCCCSTPQPCRGTGPKDDLPPGSPGRCTPKSSEPTPVHTAGGPRRIAKKTESLSNSSRSESIHNSPKSCPTPEVDTASEVEELEADNVSLVPAELEGSRGGARIQVFLARYSYNPFEGPNENPEAELPLTAGEYIYIYGNMDEDGFFEGELMDGRRGLVPSNFVERVSDDDLLTSLPLELAELSHSSGPELSFLSGAGGGSSSGGQSSGSRGQPRPEDETAGDALSLSPPPEGLGEPPAVPYPCHLAIVKQLAHSVVLAWEPPSERVDLHGYHICVNGVLRQTLGPSAPPKALLENLDLQAGPLHVSVQTLTSRGSSDPLRCCLAVGARAGVVPSQLRVHRLTATSAEITWVPGNSNLTHAIYLNGEECPPARPSTYWATFCHLRPGTLYQARVEAQLPPRGCWEAGWERAEQRAATLQFTTLPAGPPDAPLDVQVEPGPSPGILTISWLPVTIDAVGTSNGVRVTGYAIYADGQKLMEVASPTAGSVLVEVSQLQLLHMCHQVAVRTMSPHGESADSILAPVGPALAAACLPTKLSCTSPRPSLEAQAPLVPASLGPGNPSSPIQHLEAPGTLEPPGAPPANLPKETREEPSEEQPTSSSQGTVRSAVLGTSEDRRVLELTLAERLAGPTAASMAEEAEWLEEKACPAPSSTQLEPCAACHGGEAESEQKPGAERADEIELGSHQANPLVEHGRSAELSDIQEEEEEEEEEPGSRTGSSQKQVAGSSVGEEGTKPQPDPFCETDSDEEVLEQILELPLQQFCRKKLFSIPEEEEEEEEDQADEEKPGAGSSRDPGLPEPVAAAEGSGGSAHGPGPGFSSPEPCGAGDSLEDVPGIVGGSSRRRRSGSPEKPPNRRRAPDPREHCSRLLNNGGPQAPGRPGSIRERGGPPLGEGTRGGLEAGGRGRLAPAWKCSRGRAPESPMASCLSPKCLEISIECDSEEEQEAGARGLGTSSFRSVGDEEGWASAPVGRPRGSLKASSGPSPNPRLPAWEKGEPERRGRSATGRAKEPPSRVAETGEPRGQGSSGWRDPPRRGLRAPRLSAQELGPSPRSSPEAVLAHRNLPVRFFVALFDYDPMSMSPNPDAGEEELPFREGQILKVFGDKDADGFYRGEGGGRMGYIPCNMIAEVAVDSPTGRQQLLQQAFLSPEVLAEISESGSYPFVHSAAHTSGPPPKPRRSKKAETPGPAQSSAGPPQLTSACLKVPHSMVAAFDYNPRESSPNMDVEAELSFQAGDIITVFGAMDDDGFYYGELNGQRGLVPSNFLEALGPEDRDREPRPLQSEGQRMRRRRVQC